ncbi:MAG: hypothetical protein L0Y56_00675 [Nitrospira sp.]|nr:hypothetical protein [Nitrospira sp.]
MAKLMVMSDNGEYIKTIDLDFITSLLTREDDKGRRAVERAIIAIYSRQTQEEQVSESTLRLNGIGFSGADARLGSYYARWIQNGKRLSGKHLERARKMTLKYRKQLLEIAQLKEYNT